MMESASTDYAANTRIPKRLDFDSALEHIGGFGRHQLRIFFVVSLISLPLSAQKLISVFISAVPEWKCPSANGDVLHCDSNNALCCQDDGSICPGAEFSTEYTSVATEWDLVCAHRYKSELSQAIYVAGYMFGVLIFGLLSDKYGRRKPWFFAYVVGGVLTLMSTFVGTFEKYIALRFAMGAMNGGGGLITYILTTESISPSYRGMAGTWQHAFYAVGFVVLALEAYFIRDWRMLTIISILPSFIVLLVIRSIPESPRWLASQGRTKEAEHILRKIGEENGSDKNEVILLKTETTKEDTKTSQYGILDLFTHKSVCVVTVIMMILWCVNGMVYYGLALNVKNLGGSLYINFALASVIELPSFMVTQALLERLGRQRSALYFFLGASLSCFLCMFLQLQDSQNATAISITALGGRFCINASFAVAYVYSAELFPTVVRNAGMGISSLSARIGGMVAPFIVLLGDQHNSLPMFVFACTALFAAVVVVRLRETKGRPMPETFADLEDKNLRKLNSNSDLY